MLTPQNTLSPKCTMCTNQILRSTIICALSYATIVTLLHDLFMKNDNIDRSVVNTQVYKYSIGPLMCQR